MGQQLGCSPAPAVVEALGLREGDEIEITVSGRRRFKIARDLSRERALMRLRKYRRRLRQDSSLTEKKRMRGGDVFSIPTFCFI